MQKSLGVVVLAEFIVLFCPAMALLWQSSAFANSWDQFEKTFVAELAAVAQLGHRILFG